jgi:hypothetical protein
MKGLFLVSRAVAEGKLPNTEPFDYSPMDFGPCSVQVYQALDAAVAEGLVRAEPVPGETWKRYSITPTGLAQLGRAQDATEQPLLDFVQRVRNWCDAQSFTSLLQAVYRAYPDFAVNSVLPHLRPNQ